MKDYKGKITDTSGWNGPVYQVEKDNGTMSGKGEYEDIFKLGDDSYLISPYYTEHSDWKVCSAAEILDYIAIK